jgi:hypothetical protein
MPGFRPEAAFQELRDPRAPRWRANPSHLGKTPRSGRVRAIGCEPRGIRGGTPPCGFAQDSGKPIKGQEIVRQG